MGIIDGAPSTVVAKTDRLGLAAQSKRSAT